MKRNVYIPIVLIISVISILFIIANSNNQNENILSNINFTEQINNEPLNIFHDKIDDKYYVFIPSYANIGDLDFINSSKKYCVEINGDVINNKDKLDFNTVNHDLQFIIYDKHNSIIVNSKIQFIKTKNIPTISINTQSGNMDYIEEDKEHKEDISVRVISSTGEIEHNGVAEISGRGNTSWSNNAKRPYNLSFKNKTSILGIKPVTLYALFANYSDESRMRNSIVYYTARETGIKYTSDMQYADLYINGNYYGLYNICSKKYFNDDAEAKAINGVFEIASVYKFDFLSESETPINLYYGDSNYIGEVINNFESKLYSHASYEELSQLIDMESFAKKCILEEFFLNFDYYKSQYFYVDKNNKIYTANAWDYDLTMGKYFGYFNSNPSEDLMFKKYRDVWYTYLYGYEEFRFLMVNIFNSIYTPTLQNDILNKHNNDADMISYSWNSDFLRYKNEKPFGDGTLRSNIQSFHDNVLFINDYITRRYIFLNKYYNNEFINDVVIPDEINKLEIPKSEPFIQEMLKYRQGTLIMSLFVLMLIFVLIIYLKGIANNRQVRKW